MGGPELKVVIYSVFKITLSKICGSALIISHPRRTRELIFPPNSFAMRFQTESLLNSQVHPKIVCLKQRKSGCSVPPNYAKKCTTVTRLVHGADFINHTQAQKIHLALDRRSEYVLYNKLTERHEANVF